MGREMWQATFDRAAKTQTWLKWLSTHTAAATAKSLQLCPTLCDPINGSPPGFRVPGTLQTRTLEWVAISFSNAWKRKEKVKLLSRVWLVATPWTVEHQAPPSMGFSRQDYWSGVPLPSPYAHLSTNLFYCVFFPWNAFYSTIILFFNLFVFNWMIIALQFSVSLCHISTWSSQKHTYVPLSWISFSFPTSFHPIRLSQSTRLSSLCHTVKFPLPIYFTYNNVYGQCVLSAKL